MSRVNEAELPRQSGARRTSVQSGIRCAFVLRCSAPYSLAFIGLFGVGCSQQQSRCCRSVCCAFTGFPRSVVLVVGCEEDVGINGAAAGMKTTVPVLFSWNVRSGGYKGVGHRRLPFSSEGHWSESERDSGRSPSLWVTHRERLPKEGRRIAHGRRRRIGARG